MTPRRDRRLDEIERLGTQGTPAAAKALKVRVQSLGWETGLVAAIRALGKCYRARLALNPLRRRMGHPLRV